MIVTMDIGEEVKKARRKAKLTQKALALMLGTSSVYINMIENNKRVPLIKTLQRLSEITGTDLIVKLQNK